MTASPSTGARLPSLARVAVARGRVELLMFVRDRRAMVFTFLFPLILLLIFGSVFNGVVNGGVNFSQYFVAGMIASGLMYTGFQNLAIAIPMEREDGSLKRLAGTPLPRAAYFAGKVALVLVALVAQVTLLLVIGVAFFQVTVPSTPQKWLTFGWLLLVGLLVCTLLGIAFSSIPKTGRGAPALVTPVVLVLQFTSGVFFLYNQLPTWMQRASALFPLKWLCQGMRSVFLPDSAKIFEPARSWELDRVAEVLVLWAVIGAVACATTFRWQRRNER